MLQNIREQAAAAVAKGQDLEALRQGWWLEPITRSAWYETSGKPILQDDVNTGS